jgi:hypothetical protein
VLPPRFVEGMENEKIKEGMQKYFFNILNHQEV